MRKATAVRVEWQADHEQFWQGHGSDTYYDTCATGCGSTLREAFADALECLAQDDIEVSLEQEKELLADLGPSLDEDIVAVCDWPEPDKQGDHDPDCSVCAGEWHYYVSVDVKLGKGEI